MDDQTISTYNKEAINIAALHNSLLPKRLYQLINRYFIQNEPTADIGCGTGRDTSWLIQEGFPAIGIDASSGMLIQANETYPNLTFTEDFLPELSTLDVHHPLNHNLNSVRKHL